VAAKFEDAPNINDVKIPFYVEMDGGPLAGSGGET
jgi:hypothetical protein